MSLDPSDDCFPWEAVSLPNMTSSPLNPCLWTHNVVRSSESNLYILTTINSKPKQEYHTDVGVEHIPWDQWPILMCHLMWPTSKMYPYRLGGWAHRLVSDSHAIHGPLKKTHRITHWHVPSAECSKINAHVHTLVRPCWLSSANVMVNRCNQS